MTWLFMAVLSALFAGLTSILAKCGIRKTDSDVATALRTIVVLLFSWIMVFVVDSQHTICNIDNTSLVFLILSGLATGASWICYFKALSMGDINVIFVVDFVSRNSYNFTLIYSANTCPFTADNFGGICIVANYPTTCYR